MKVKAHKPLVVWGRRRDEYWNLSPEEVSGWLDFLVQHGYFHKEGDRGEGERFGPTRQLLDLIEDKLDEAYDRSHGSLERLRVGLATLTAIHILKGLNIPATYKELQQLSVMMGKVVHQITTGEG